MFQYITCYNKFFNKIKSLFIKYGKDDQNIWDACVNLLRSGSDGGKF